MNKKILIASGHAATTAYALLEELLQSPASKDYDFLWVGSKNAIEGKVVPTLESKLAHKLGVKFIPITAGKLHRNVTFWNLFSFIKLPVGFIMGLKIVISERPSVIVSFGGYAAFPVVLAGALMRIPVVIHEQTSAAGLSNRLSARFAKKIFLAHESSLSFFPGQKASVIGNPVSLEILSVKPKLKISSAPVLFVTCGSRGAQKINNVLFSALPELVKKFNIIHLTGDLDYRQFKNLRDTLPGNLQSKYEIYSSVLPEQIAEFYKRSDLLFTRAGANTVTEIVLIKRPSVIVPLPFSYQEEQLKNALYAQSQGIAKVLEQKNLTPKTLISSIEEVAANWEFMVKNSLEKEANPDFTAAKKFAKYIHDCLN